MPLVYEALMTLSQDTEQMFPLGVAWLHHTHGSDLQTIRDFFLLFIEGSIKWVKRRFDGLQAGKMVRQHLHLGRESFRQIEIHAKSPPAMAQRFCPVASDRIWMFQGSASPQVNSRCRAMQAVPQLCLQAEKKSRRFAVGRGRTASRGFAVES